MKALLIVDVQNDFLPGGSLEVNRGDQIIPVINRLIPSFDLVIATQDWHPADHGSFASNHPDRRVFEEIQFHGLAQTLWPDHCVQGSRGAALSEALEQNRIEAIFRKGMDPEIDSYSAFFDNGHRKSTGLSDYLKGKQVKELYVCGLAGDICVHFTCMDALHEGFHTCLIRDAAKPIDTRQFETRMQTFQEKGGRVADSSELMHP